MMQKNPERGSLMKYPLLMLMITLLVNSTPTGAGASQTSEQGQAVKLLQRLASADDPGIQYIIVNKERVVFEHCTGLADLKNGIPLTPNHTMAAFSMTKTVTAIAILQLVEKGLIGLDDIVASHVRHPYGQEITIRQLLSHTSGAPNPIPLKWVHLSKDHQEFSEDRALDAVLKNNPKADHAPGKKYRYSNIGYWLLGKIVENVTQQSFTTYVVKNIFEPLSLKPDEISFEITAPKNHAKGYLAKFSFMNLLKGFVTDEEVWGEYEGRWLRIKDVYVNGPSFGGALGSARAFGRILQDLLSDDSMLLGEPGKQLFFTQQKNSAGKAIEMTLGWHIGELDGIEYFYKEGGGAGFHCEMRIYPSVGLGSVIMANRTSLNTRKILRKIDNHFVNQ